MFATPLQAFYLPSLHRREGLSQAPSDSDTYPSQTSFIIADSGFFWEGEKKEKEIRSVSFQHFKQKKKLLIKKKSLSEENLHLLLVAANGSLTFLGVTNHEVPHEI